MKITTIKISKSRTFGITKENKTRYQKIDIEMSAEVDSDLEDTTLCYNNLSLTIEKALEEEVKLAISNLKS